MATRDNQQKLSAWLADEDAVQLLDSAEDPLVSAMVDMQIGPMDLTIASSSPPQTAIIVGGCSFKNPFLAVESDILQDGCPRQRLVSS